MQKRRPQSAGVRKTWKPLLVRGVRGALIVLVVVVWAVLGATQQSVASFMSTPTDVLDQLRAWATGPDAAWADLLATLRVALVGLVIGSGIGVAAAVLLTELPALRRFLSPFIAVANVLPKVALIPLFILWLGIGDSSKVAFVAVSVFFIVFYSVLTRCAEASSAIRDHVRVIGGGRLQLVTHLLFPTAWGAVMSSLRLSVAFSLFGAVLTQMMAANEGMGYLLATGQATLQPDDVVAAVIVISTVAMVVDAVLASIDRRLARWREA